MKNMNQDIKKKNIQKYIQKKRRLCVRGLRELLKPKDGLAVAVDFHAEGGHQPVTGIR